jgi:hypothetical protein
MSDETIILGQYHRLIKKEVGWPTEDLEVSRLPGPNVNGGYILAAGNVVASWSIIHPTRLPDGGCAKGWRQFHVELERVQAI